MADQTNNPTPDSDVPSAALLSSAPGDYIDSPPDSTNSSTAKTDSPARPLSSSGADLPAEPLPDGTLPTILRAGQSHKSVAKSRTSLTSVYQRADIMTTLITLGGALIAGALIIGAYYFLAKQKTATDTKTKVTTVDSSDLAKLGTFLNGNSAGSSDQVLTVSPISSFNGRVASSNDLKIVGKTDIAGATTLSDLVVSKSSTLGVTTVRGSLAISGPLNLQSPAQLGAGANVSNDLAATGNGTFGGSISTGTINVPTLTVNAALAITGHLEISGQNPSATPGAESGPGATATVTGNDSSGTVTITTGSIPTGGLPGGELVTVTFHTAYSRAGTVIITPVGRGSAALEPYMIKTAKNFAIGTANTANSNQSYSFDYWVVQ